MAVSSRDLSSIQIVAAIRQGIDATQRGDYSAALRVFNAVYGSAGSSIPTGLSYYGLCLARGEKRFNAAIKACQSAIDQEFYDANHYVNLIRVYLAAGSRKKAVEVLEKALARMPKDADILAIREEMGYRSQTVFPSLHRDNVLNLVGGKLRHRLRSFHLTNGMKYAIAALFLVVWFGGILWFLMRLR